MTNNYENGRSFHKLRQLKKNKLVKKSWQNLIVFTLYITRYYKQFFSFDMKLQKQSNYYEESYKMDGIRIIRISYGVSLKI